MAYLMKISADTAIFNDINPAGIIPMVISDTNISQLSKFGTIEPYILFFRRNYR